MRFPASGPFSVRGARSILAGLLTLSVLCCWTQTLRAANEGQEDLDQAFDRKLAAKELSDLGDVIDLCESALKKGLDDSNTATANNLLVGTLMQRANVFTKAIVEQTRGWGQLRIQAIDDLNKAIKIDPKLAPAHLLIARLQSLPGGDRAAALKAAEQAADLSKDDPAAQVDALLMQANLSEDAEKTLALFGQALKIAPKNVSALRERGMFLFLAGKMEDALPDLEAAAKADPENPDVQEARGTAYLRLKKNDEAAQAFGELIKASPDLAIPYLQRAFVYALEHKSNEALDDISQAMKKDSRNAITSKAPAFAGAGAFSSGR